MKDSYSSHLSATAPAKTELIYRSNCAKNSLNRLHIGTIVYRQFSMAFAFEPTSGQWTCSRKIGCPLSANSNIIFSAILSRIHLVDCEGCDIVQSDHAPQAGVAQGIFNGDLIRRRVGHQVELEEELDEEVERRVRRDHSRDNTQVRMHG